MSLAIPLFAFEGWKALALAAAIGLAFGWTLERAGLGSAKKLAGQFYFTDFTVFKVMFSAILTALVGVSVLGWAGIIDPATLPVPNTFVAPQIAGGLLFGVGFVLGGLCPGTSCVAAAAGRGDGLAVVAGLLGGILVTGLAFAPIADFYASTPRGRWRLPEALGVPEGLVVIAVMAVAFAGFFVAERLEKRR